jgi:hypothetical protein
MIANWKGAAFAAGLALTLGAAGTSNAQNVYLRVTSAATPLSTSGSEVGVLSVTIPAGTWTVTSKLNPVNFGSGDYVRCRILVGTAQKDSGTTYLGLNPSGEPGSYVTSLALQTAVVTTAPQTFALRCGHDFAVAGQYIDPGASLMIVRNTGPVS